MHSCAVLVVSSDGYSDLWEPFFRLFWRHWADCPFPVYLGTQTLRPEFPGVRALNAGLHWTWSKSLRRFLEQIEAEHVLLLLEDFFLCGKVSTVAMLELLQALRELKGAAMRLHPDPPATVRLSGRPKIREQHRLAPYRVSLQASFWERQALSDLLRDDESPWEFELNGTIRAQARARGFYCTAKREFPYRQAVERGRWFWTAARRQRQVDAGYDLAARPVMSPLTAACKALAKASRRWRGLILTLPLRTRETDPYATPSASGAQRVAFLTNQLPPYHKPVLNLLARRYAALRVLLSTEMEANRPWKADWRGLDVIVQKTLTTRGVWHHPRGFSEPLTIHFPLDTIQQLKRFSPDVAISAEMGARTFLAMVYRKLNQEARLIIWAEAAESTERGRGLARYLARKVFVKNADAFLAVGSSAVKYLLLMGAPAAKIFQIPYTTDIERFSAVPLARTPERAHRLLFCGQFVERKGLIPFLQVLSRWAGEHPERTVRIDLAGEGPQAAQIAALPLAENVKLEFLGVFQYGDLPEIYAAGGVFVLATLADTWGVVINEALAAGLPVLGSVYAQAVEELIQDGYNGWIFAPDDAQDTYLAIDRMMNTSHGELDLMRERGRTLAGSLSPARVADLIDAAVRYSAQNPADR